MLYIIIQNVKDLFRMGYDRFTSKNIISYINKINFFQYLMCIAINTQ